MITYSAQKSFGNFKIGNFKNIDPKNIEIYEEFLNKVHSKVNEITENEWISRLKKTHETQKHSIENSISELSERLDGIIEEVREIQCKIEAYKINN